MGLRDSGTAKWEGGRANCRRELPIKLRAESGLARSSRTNFTHKQGKQHEKTPAAVEARRTGNAKDTGTSAARIPFAQASDHGALLVKGSGALGLTSPKTGHWLLWSKQTAVCVPPGARLLLSDIPKTLQQQFGVEATEEATFVQLSAEAYEYRDAVQFGNGREVLLQCLRFGQHVDVLSLCSCESREEEHQRQEEEYRRIFVG